jgi:hypothetical protein
MRISTLFALFLVGWLTTGDASASDQSLSHSSPSVSANLDFFPQPASAMAVDQYRLPKRNLDSSGLRATPIAESRDKVCYKMRSYKVARTERFDGSNETVEYSTCQPSSGYEVKETDDPAVLSFP